MKNIDKIRLNKNSGPIVFLGSMNAMPMMYAIELKKMGYEVIYFVDRPKNDLLHRPESHFKDISYPYPSWIIEIKLKSQILIPFFRLYFMNLIINKIKQRSDNKPQLFVINGFFITLAPFFKKKEVEVVSLSHGSDLDSWADTSVDNSLKEKFVKYSLFKFMPKFLSKKLIPLIIRRQFLGLLSSEKVIYFPKGFNEKGDKVIEKLNDLNISCEHRYDVSFEPLKYQNRNYKINNDKLVIFSGVRFTYKTFSEGNEGYSKGNDTIIKGIALYYSKYKDIEVHFVEKGPDVRIAKDLCEKLGISEIVTWHKEMKFLELLDLYNKSDICFDQVGQHWVGAIGAYALWLGKPLIANISLPLKVGIWPNENPIANASSEKEIFNHLERLRESEYREIISSESKKFAEKYFGPHKLLNEIFIFN